MILVGIPVFLKFCGVNHYFIPIYFENYLPDSISCPDVQLPYTLENFQLNSDMVQLSKALTIDKKKKIIVLVHDDLDVDLLTSEIGRILDLFHGLEKINVMFIHTTNTTSMAIEEFNNASALYSISLNESSSSSPFLKR